MRIFRCHLDSRDIAAFKCQMSGISVLNGSLSIRGKLRIIVAAVIAVAAVGGFASTQIAKGAYFHLLNVLHLKYSVAVDHELRRIKKQGVSSPAEFKDVRAMISMVREQPIACLEAVNIMDRMIMDLIGTGHTVSLCANDVVAGNAVLKTLDDFEAGIISTADAITAVEEANRIFLKNSDDFEEPVFATVDFIVWSMTTLLAVMGLGIALLVWKISIGISRPLQALSGRTKALCDGDIISPVPAVDLGDEIGVLARAIESSRVAAQQMQELTLEREKQNAAMRLVLENVNDGLLILNENGIIQSGYSSALVSFFGEPKPEQNFGEYISSFSENAAAYFQLAWEGLEEGFLPRDVVLGQFPKRIAVDSRTFGLEYNIILDTDQETFKGMMVIISDITESLRAQLTEAKMKDTVRLFEGYCRDEGGVVSFFEETGAMISKLDNSSTEAESINVLKRSLHTIKGNSAMYGLDSFSGLVHRLEDQLNEVDPSDVDVESIKAEWSELEGLLNGWSKDKNDVFIVDFVDYEWLVRTLQANTMYPEILARIETWKWQKTKSSLDRLGRYAQSLARRLGKGSVTLVVEDDDMRLPKHPWDSLWAVLSHVVRNAVDHGLESPQVRSSCGKAAAGCLKLKTSQSEDFFTISIQDDGSGIDWDRLRTKAKKIGIDAHTPEQLQTLLFQDGVSARDEVTAISGRGVGMAAVAEIVKGLGGTIQVFSEPGEGTCFEFEFPKKRRAKSRSTSVRNPTVFEV